MNFLLGGRMGDLIHALYVAKNTPGKHNLLVTDRRDLHSDGFLKSLDETHAELMPIISAQDYCGGFFPYVYDALNLPIDQNLSMWRRYAYSASWTQLLSNTFGVPTNGEPWIKWSKISGWQNIIVVHASSNPHRRGYNWNVVMSMYAGQCVFVGNPEEYNVFGFKIPFYQPETLSEHLEIINSCKMFIGNQSAPLAMAHALGVTRIAMLNEIDKIHYVGEERFCKNYFWLAESTHSFPGLDLE